MESAFQAYFTALKVLRQRCEFLQKKLDCLEEENCQLKLQQIQTTEKLKNLYPKNSVEEQILSLNRQNLKISHQLQMVTNENQNLWSQVSKLISGDNTLGNILSAPSVSADIVSEKFNEHSEGGIGDLPLLDYSKESLEEISFKLINSILMGKNELENQYSQMLDLQKDHPLKSHFSLLPSQFDCRITTNIIKDYIEKLKDFKKVLYQQKSDLGRAITNIKTLPKDFGHYSRVKKDNFSSPDIMTTYDSLVNPGEIDEGNDSDLNRICPICGKVYAGQFNIFCGHVNSHFEDGS